MAYNIQLNFANSAVTAYSLRKTRVPRVTGRSPDRSSMVFSNSLKPPSGPAARMTEPFSGGIGTVKGFAALMARCAAEEFGGEFDLVSFVPVSDKRRRERGWDQAERLAAEMAKQWDTKAVRLLKKTRHTAAQSSLNDGAQREANVFGVYEAVNAEQIRGARILLVDDVVTTGATMKECVRVLRDAGASEVLGIALATPLEKDKK
jgi:ComF family protein